MSNESRFEQMLSTQDDWSETDLRLEALRQAVEHSSPLYSSEQVVSAAADFYNFLNGELITSNIDKLSAIADILSDE